MGKHQIITGLKSGSDDSSSVYAEEYVKAYITLLLFDAYESQDGLTREYIVNKLIQKYPGQTINQRKLSDFLSTFARFVDRNNINDSKAPFKYTLFDFQCSLANKLEQFNLYFAEFIHEDRTNLKKKAINYLRENFIKTSYICSIISALDSFNHSDRNAQYYLGAFYSYLSSIPALCYALDEGFLEIDESNCQLPVSVLITNPIVIEYLASEGIEKLGQMQLCNSYVLSDALFLDYNQIISLIDLLKRDARDCLIERITSALSLLKKNEKDYLFARHAVSPYSEVMTLEEIGQRDGLTRERVRQIAAKSESKLLSDLSIIDAFNFLITKYFFNKNYASYEDLSKILQDGISVALLKFVCLENTISPIAYWEEIGVFYQKGRISKDAILEELIPNQPALITKEEYAGLSGVKQRAVNFTYKQRNGVYTRKGINKVELWEMVLDEEFPEGYHPYNEEDYQKLCDALITKYGTDYELPTQTAVRGVFGRNDRYCQIGRGVFKARNLVAEYLPESLASTISDYVIDHAPSVYYKSIFSAFEIKLRELNINDSYLLKGLLDPQLDKDVFVTERNYIKIKGTNQTARELLYDFISQQEQPFSLEDFERRFPGVKDYTLLDSLYKRNDVIFLTGKRFVLGKKSGVSAKAIDILHSEIVSACSQSSNHVISVNRMYGKLRLLHRKLFEEMGCIQTSYDLFSYCQWKFSKEFVFSRPFLSANQNVALTSTDILYNYLATLERIDKSIVDDYIATMNLHTWTRFVDIIDDFSTDYIQTDRLVLIKKNKVIIPEYVLNDIAESLSLLTRNKKSLNGSSFNAYQMFPTINGFRWNQFLLAGIVQTYLYDEFTVNRTSNNSSIYDCVITSN